LPVLGGGDQEYGKKEKSITKRGWIKHGRTIQDGWFDQERGIG
jgi:hypothetical protein